MAQRSDNPTRVREKILKQAIEEFSRMGLEGGRVDRIAERSRVSKNMLYYYFKSKEGLFVAALDRTYEQLREQQKDISIRASDPVVAMQQLVHHTFHALENNPHAIRLMNEENKHRGKYLRKSEQIRYLYTPLVETIQFVLEQGRSDSIFRASIDAHLLYMTLSSLCYHYLSNQYTLEIALGRNLTSEQSRQGWLDHVTNLILLHCAADPTAMIANKKVRRSVGIGPH